MAEEESLNFHYQNTIHELLQMHSHIENSNSMVDGNRRAHGTDEKPRTSNEDNRWSDHGAELLELIMNRLRYPDHYNMKNVCKSWHCYCIGYRRRRQQVPACLISPPPKQQVLPWLLNIVADHEGSWSSCKMFDPMFKRTYTINMNPLKDKIRHLNNWKVCESKLGYLLLVSSPLGPSQPPALGVGPPQLSLMQPLQWATILEPPRRRMAIRPQHGLPLPALAPNSSSAYDLDHYLIMYSPFLTSNNLLELPVLNLKGRILLATFDINHSFSGNLANCLFVVLEFVRNYTLGISTCRWGDDTWISQNIECDFPLGCAIRWMYSDGNIYYATSAPLVGAFDLDKQEWSIFPVPNCTRFILGVHLIKSVDGCHLYLFCYDAESHWSQHFRLDLSQQSTSQSTASGWELVGNRNDNRVVVFVGNGYKSVMELGEGSGRGRVGRVLCEIGNRIYISNGVDLIKYATFLNQKRTYPCTKLYGSLASQQCVRNMWIETPY